MEQRVEYRLNVQLCRHLSDSVFYRWDSQNSNSAVFLGDFYCHDRFRKIAPRAHSVPQLVQIVLQVSFVIFKPDSVYTWAAPIGLYLPVSEIHDSFVDMVLFAAFHSFLLFSQLTCFSQPIDGTPSLRRHYSGFVTTTGTSAPTCSFSTFGLIFLRFVPFRFSSTRRFPRSVHWPAPRSCHLNAGCRTASYRSAALLVPVWW